MRRVGHKHLLARIAFGLVVRADEKDAGELAMCPSRRLQRDRVHAGDVDEALLQQLDDLERALCESLGLVRMRLGEAFNARDEFVDARVVLHRAAAERIHAEIDGVVPRGKARKVADDFDLAHFGHVAEVFSFGRTEERCRIDFGYIERRQFPRGFAWRGFLEDQAFVLVYLERGFAGHVLQRKGAPLPLPLWQNIRSARSRRSGPRLCRWHCEWSFQYNARKGRCRDSG